LNEPASVSALIENYVARGVFRAAALPSTRSGRETYRIRWFRNQTMHLDVDVPAGRVRLSDVLPPIAPRSKLDRALRAWLRSRESPELPAHRRLDPAQFQAGMRNAGGSVRFSVVSKTDDPTGAARKLLNLVNELYLDFLAAPERYDWITDAFDLDPDNPRWP
jgi:hypothetical protein